MDINAGFCSKMPACFLKISNCFLRYNCFGVLLKQEWLIEQLAAFPKPAIIPIEIKDFMKGFSNIKVDNVNLLSPLSKLTTYVLSFKLQSYLTLLFFGHDLSSHLKIFFDYLIRVQYFQITVLVTILFLLFLEISSNSMLMEN